MGCGPRENEMALCACMGPQGSDPLCPCQMRAAGREPTPIWKPGDKEKLQRAMEVLLEREDEEEKSEYCECGAAHSIDEEDSGQCDCCGGII